LPVNVLQLLRDLIAIPSVNPMRQSINEPVGPVERGVADYVEEVIRRERIDCERQLVQEGRENLIAILQPTVYDSRERAGLMFNTHMDTVPVENMSIAPFDPVVSGGLIYGRGACDAKGSIAAMLAAFIHHAKMPVRPVPVVFAATVDEEFSFSGAWKLIEREWPVKSCVVGEPTRLQSIIAHKGVARWRVKVRGKSAHGATPQLGRNAIYDGARVALALEAYAGALSERAAHPLLGSPSMNVGRVSGGQAVNVVPDMCEFELERRLLPGENGEAEVRDCEGWVRAYMGDGVEFSADAPYLVDPPMDTPFDAPVVLGVCEAHRAVTGRECKTGGAHYGTDGSKLARAGIQAVVCGPGDIAQAHTRDEFIEIEQLELAERLYSRLIERWPFTREN
jgi:acetylornithine deacetylase/succinyl-diaminopimelate desuccinylase family protein